MDRLSVITRAALALRATRPLATPSAPPAAALPSMALVEKLCAVCAPNALLIERAPQDDVVLGGARARLQLRNWTKPERGGHIWVRDDLSPQDQAFSIAHELGHFILHRGEGETPRCPVEAINEDADIAPLRVTRENRVEQYNPRARRELEANAFAAELLAPGRETRDLFLASDRCDETRIAEAFGISSRLARARLVAAMLTGVEPQAAPDIAQQEEPVIPALSGGERRALAASLLDGLDDSQRAAATAEGPALVVAGPGTGKTATLVARVGFLYGAHDIQPETILALTFSNRATDEMRARLIDSGLPGERIPVMTIHAFAAEILRNYAGKAPHAEDEPPLPSDFRILDTLDALLLLEELLPTLKLRRLRSLSDPTAPLRGLLDCFGWARDRLLTPGDYLALVVATPPAPAPEPVSNGGKRSKEQQPEGTFTSDQLAQAREQARAYAIWDRALRQRGLLDYGGLIQRAVELFRAAPEALVEARRRFPHVLVDEFQDTNEAAATLLFLLAGEDGAGLWVVGDRNQSIYRWRGASPDNLPALTRHYPRLGVHTLKVNYRSVPDIVRLGSDMAARMAALAGADDPALQGRTGSEDEAVNGPLAEALRPVTLLPHRAAGDAPAVWRGEEFPTPAGERQAIIADMRRRYAAGLAWGDMAALAYKSKYGRALASDLTAGGIPVSVRGDYFARHEIKDALAYFRLAASRDVGGLLRARGLIALLGVRAVSTEDGRALGRATRKLAQDNAVFPWALNNRELLRAAGVPTALIEPLTRLGEGVVALWYAGSGMSRHLASALLLPGGMAWRLARIAAELDEPAVSADDPLGEPGSGPARARDALAALGALVSLAARFDVRWANEPGFKLQLSGLAARDEQEQEAVLASQPAQAGFVAARPLGADSSASPAPASPAPASPAPAAPSEAEKAGHEDQPERAARCFLRYLTTYARSGDEVALPLSEEDAVHILTIHGAKGLEFPAVYVHEIAPSGFSAGNGAKPVRPWRGRSEDREEAGRQAELRCLLYVATTRARDTLILTRARMYKDNAKNPEAPLPAAEILQASALYLNAAELPPAPASDIPSAPVPPDALDEEDEAGSEEDALADVASGGEEPPGDAIPHPAAPDLPVYDYYALERYTTCPRAYRYRELYHLRDLTGTAVNAFHRFIRTGLAAQRTLRSERPEMAPAQAREALATLWAQQSGVRGTFGETYRDYALDILDAEWARRSEDGEAKRLELTVRLRACAIKLNVDAIIRPAPDGDRVILERLHTGRPSEKHKTDPRLPLMLIGYQQFDLRAHVVCVRLVYVGAPLSEVGAASDTERAAAASRRQVEDVTDRARKYAEEYWAGRPAQYDQLFKLDRAARGIAARRFEPHPGDRCASCDYAHICPGDLPE